MPLLPQTGFEVESSLDDLPHVAGLVRGELAPGGEDPARGGEVLKGLVRLEEPQVGVVESVYRQLLGALVVGHDQNEVGCTCDTKTTQKWVSGWSPSGWACVRHTDNTGVLGHDQD